MLTLISQDGRIKLTDFGFAANAVGRDGERQRKTFAGAVVESFPVLLATSRHPLLDGTRSGQEPGLWQEGGRLVGRHPGHRDAGGGVSP